MVVVPPLQTGELSRCAGFGVDQPTLRRRAAGVFLRPLPPLSAASSFQRRASAAAWAFGRRAAGVAAHTRHRVFGGAPNTPQLRHVFDAPSRGQGVTAAIPASVRPLARNPHAVHTTPPTCSVHRCVIHAVVSGMPVRFSLRRLADRERLCCSQRCSLGQNDCSRRFVGNYGSELRRLYQSVDRLCGSTFLVGGCPRRRFQTLPVRSVYVNPPLSVLPPWSWVVFVEEVWCPPAAGSLGAWS